LQSAFNTHRRQRAPQGRPGSLAEDFMSNNVSKLAQRVSEQEAAIVQEWVRQLQVAGALQSGRIKEAEL
jgi:hypothetical protein